MDLKHVKKFTIDELNNMTKNELILIITTLQDQANLSFVEEKENRIHFGGSPKWVKNHYDETIRIQRSDKR